RRLRLPTSRSSAPVERVWHRSRSRVVDRCGFLPPPVLRVLTRVDRQEINDIRHRVHGREGDPEISFYCECSDPDCRAGVALRASAFADLRRQSMPILFLAHVPDEDSPLALEHEYGSELDPSART